MTIETGISNAEVFNAGERFEILLRRLIDGVSENSPLSGVDVVSGFQPYSLNDADKAPNINAAFLILLCGHGHPGYARAAEYLDRSAKDSQWRDVVDFLIRGVERIHREIKTVCAHNREVRRAMDEAALWCQKGETRWDEEGRSKIWGLFFPEGAWCQGNSEERIAALRFKRAVHITDINESPVQKPAREVLFLSNLLLTIPASRESIKNLPCEAHVVERLQAICSEKQQYWYDHPIQIGVQNENNEALYGLRGLDRAMAFEKKRGLISPKDRVTCLLSVSVTHAGLHDVVKDYLRGVYAGVSPFDHLIVYLFSEKDTDKILEEVFKPALNRYMPGAHMEPLRRVFGVDGEYGRHFSFLKAMSALWQVLVDPAVKASFKIDLDQVFDQEKLVRETGHSALEHLMTPLWGAKGTDAGGEPVDLGLLAGALVNADDMEKGLFTPDVPMPESIPNGEAAVFYSPLPQAISTRAEMMARYEKAPLDGIHECLQRIHVTGGTTGTLVRSLRCYRPFTPSFMGRAEDQAYVMGSLFSAKTANLRYVHKPGLIMRHDKSLFASEAIRGAKPGKYVGDLARILLFSAYADALSWPLEKTKKELDPFTGCFISKLPLTVVYLRLSLHLAERFSAHGGIKVREGEQLLKLAADRLGALMDRLESGTGSIKENYRFEKMGWHLFYDLLDHLEKALLKNDPFAIDLRKKAMSLFKECRL